MKILTLLVAVCSLGIASCGQKTCPAYSKSNSDKATIYAKQTAPISDHSKI